MLRPFWSVCLTSIALYAGLASTAAQETAPIESKFVAEAQHLIGLQFSEVEREMMVPLLQRHRAQYDRIRTFGLTNGVPPALVFDPIPIGMKFSTQRQPIQWSKPGPLSTQIISDSELAWSDIGELGALLRARIITSERITRLCLERLERFDGQLHCVVTLLKTNAMEQALRADAELRAGIDRGPLHGIPYGAKDLLAVQGVPTTWGAAPFTNQVFNFDATVVRKLEQAGAVLVAKLSLGELAMGDGWYGGRTRNPWNTNNGSSGSSAGSAAAVAAGLVPFAIGSETVGSIVSPATVCGVTGLRPTFGRVSRAGAMALAWSSDKIGPIARTAEDCARVFAAIHGADPQDVMARDLPFNYDARKQVTDLRIGYLKSDFDRARLNQTNHAATMELLRRLGAKLLPVELPKLPVDDLMFIIDVEAAAAFDDLTRSNADDRLAQQGPGSWPNILRAARFIPAVEYIQANRVRHSLIQAMATLMDSIDVLIAPAWDGEALKLTNLTGHPCVVVPNGEKTGSNPASITFIGRLFGEAEALAVARSYQAATGFHRQRPPLTSN